MCYFLLPTKSLMLDGNNCIYSQRIKLLICVSVSLSCSPLPSLPPSISLPPFLHLYLPPSLPSFCSLLFHLHHSRISHLHQKKKWRQSNTGNDDLSGNVSEVKHVWNTISRIKPRVIMLLNMPIFHFLETLFLHLWRKESLESKFIIKHPTHVIAVYPPLHYHYFFSEIMKNIAIAAPF